MGDFFGELLVGLRCTSLIFLDMLGCARLKLSGWVELGPLCYLSNFLMSCYDRSSLHESVCLFVCFFRHAMSHTAHTQWVDEIWANKDLLSYFLVSSYCRGSLHVFFFFLSSSSPFLAGMGSWYDSSYLDKFLCFYNFGFCEMRPNWSQMRPHVYRCDQI